MNIVCLDLEGVLVPEIWIAFAKASGIPELKRTTRDEPDYDKLMNWRLGILKEHGLGLKEIQETIATIDPIPGAKEFLDELRKTTQVIIISDTFTQFAAPLMEKLGLRWYAGCALCRVPRLRTGRIPESVEKHPNSQDDSQRAGISGFWHLEPVDSENNAPKAVSDGENKENARMGAALHGADGSRHANYAG